MTFSDKISLVMHCGNFLPQLATWKFSSIFLTFHLTKKSNFSSWNTPIFWNFWKFLLFHSFSSSNLLENGEKNFHGQKQGWTTCQQCYCNRQSADFIKRRKRPIWLLSQWFRFRITQYGVKRNKTSKECKKTNKKITREEHHQTELLKVKKLRSTNFVDKRNYKNAVIVKHLCKWIQMHMQVKRYWFFEVNRPKVDEVLLGWGLFLFEIKTKFVFSKTKHNSTFEHNL